MTCFNESMSLAKFTELLNRHGWKHTYAFTVGGSLPVDFKIEDCLEGFDYTVSLEVLSELDGVWIKWLRSAIYVSGASGGLIRSPDHPEDFDLLIIEGVSVFNTSKRDLDTFVKRDRRALLRIMPETFLKFDHSTCLPATLLTALEAK